MNKPHVHTIFQNGDELVTLEITGDYYYRLYFTKGTSAWGLTLTDNQGEWITTKVLKLPSKAEMLTRLRKEEKELYE